MKLGYIAIDQYGTHYKIEKSPRKELLDQLYATRAEKMYTDVNKNGEWLSKHVGYIINGLWINVYAVHEWKAAK